MRPLAEVCREHERRHAHLSVRRLEWLLVRAALAWLALHLADDRT